MKKRFLYIALIALTLGACTEQDIVEQPSIPTDGGTEVRLPADVNSGELLIKFKPEMTDILDRTMTRAAGNGGVMTRSGIPSTDEVLEILGGYHFERIFPVDSKNEERTRIAGPSPVVSGEVRRRYRLAGSCQTAFPIRRNLKGTGQQPHQARLQPQKPPELCEPGSPATAGSHPKRSSGPEDSPTPDLPTSGTTPTPATMLSTRQTVREKPLLAQ